MYLLVRPPAMWWDIDLFFSRYGIHSRLEFLVHIPTYFGWPVFLDKLFTESIFSNGFSKIINIPKSKRRKIDEKMAKMQIFFSVIFSTLLRFTRMVSYGTSLYVANSLHFFSLRRSEENLKFFGNKVKKSEGKFYL